jgi:hypothetical protein
VLVIVFAAFAVLLLHAVLHPYAVAASFAVLPLVIK